MKNLFFIYDAFGNEKGISARDTNPFRYCGEWWDKQTKRLYLRARDYDSGTGKFTGEDPIRSGLNWYTYCHGDPVNYIDPWGLERDPAVVNELQKYSENPIDIAPDGTPYAPLGYSIKMPTNYINKNAETINQPVAFIETDNGMYIFDVNGNQTIGGFAGYNATMPKTPTTDIEKLAALILGEAGNTGYSDWRENMQAVARIFLNLVNIGMASNFMSKALWDRFSGYDEGLDELKKGNKKDAWYYAYMLAALLLDGYYNAIPCPEGITDRHIAVYYAPRGDLTGFKKTKYYNKYADTTVPFIIIGDNVFYAQWPWYEN